MSDKLEKLRALLEDMLVTNAKISARSVARMSSGLFRHPTDITRNEQRMTLVLEYADRQRNIRIAIEKSSKKSRAELERIIAAKNAEIERIKSDRDLLVASHRAMILAVTETGGFPAWKRFFDGYKQATEQLSLLRAMPPSEVGHEGT